MEEANNPSTDLNVVHHETPVGFNAGQNGKSGGSSSDHHETSTHSSNSSPKHAALGPNPHLSHVLSGFSKASSLPADQDESSKKEDNGIAGHADTRTSIRSIFMAMSFNFTRRSTKIALPVSDDIEDRTLSEGSRCQDQFSMPAFKLRPFRRDGSQNTDLIIIYTNAIRHESRTLFTILYCLYERRAELHIGDIESFFVWFGDYHDFFCTFITLVNDIFLPALRDLVPFRHLTPQYFANEGERLNRIVAKTNSSAEVITNRYAPSEATRKLLQVYSSFAQPVLWYLFSLEKYCAVVIERFASDDDTRAVSLAMATTMRTMLHFKRTLPILLRFLEHRPQTTFLWLRQHYHFHTIRLYRFWKRPREHERTLEYFQMVCKSRLKE